MLRWGERLFLFGLFAGALLASAAPARAHPHVWVTAKAQVIFDAAGKVAAIRHVWEFDDMYSAFATQGLGKDGAPPTPVDLAPLAKTNVESLVDFDYFTRARAGNAKIVFAQPTEYGLVETLQKRVVLTFTLPLKSPASAATAFTFQVYDPSYFVAFSLDPQDPVDLVNAPPGCSAKVLGADPLSRNESQKLSEAFFSGLSPGDDFGIRLASRVIVACP